MSTAADRTAADERQPYKCLAAHEAAADERQPYKCLAAHEAAAGKRQPYKYLLPGWHGLRDHRVCISGFALAPFHP